MENAEKRPLSRSAAAGQSSGENLHTLQPNTEERPSSKSSVRGQSSSENLLRQPAHTLESSLRGENSGNLRNQPDQQQGHSRIDLIAGDGLRKSSRLIAMATPANPAQNMQQIAAGDSWRSKGASQSAANGTQKSASRTQNAAAGSHRRGSAVSLMAKSSERISTAVQSVSSRLNMLNISRKSEGAQRQPKKDSKAGRSKSIPASSSRRSAKPGGEVNAQKLVLSAMGELKSRKGVSLAAIDRHISAKLGAQAAHWRPYVRVFLRKAIHSGKLVLVKGRGLAGSFKEAPKVRTKEGAAKSGTNKSKKVSGNKKLVPDSRKKLSKLKKPAKNQQRQQASLRQNKHNHKSVRSSQ